MWVRATVATLCLSGSASGQILNPGFEDPGLLGVSSDYDHTPMGNTDEGTWWISPWDVGTPWNTTQHTPGGVGAMNVNGDNSSAAGVRRVWYQLVPVIAGRRYRFGVWALGTQGGTSGYSIVLNAEGAAVSPVFSPSAARLWEEHLSEPFVATDSVVELSVMNVSGVTFPNDFMLDDLTLADVTECIADFAPPFGTLNFFDVSAFIAAYNIQALSADLAEPTGSWNFFDVSAFIAAYNSGCP